MSCLKLKTFLLIGPFLLFSFFLPVLVTAQVGGGINGRIQADDNQTRIEAEKIDEAQRQDYEECEAETSGGNPGGGTPPGGTPPGGTPPGGTPGDGTPNPQDQQQDDEDTTRAELADAGYSVNNSNDCDGMTYQAYQQANGRSCTDVAGLPQHSIDRLAQIHNDAGCVDNITLTGGTEAGHSSHGVGRNIVDLERGKPCLNNYIRDNTVSRWNSSYGTYHQLNNGDLFLDEGNHWHADLRGGTIPGGPSTFAIEKQSPFFTLNWLNEHLKKIGGSLYPTTAEASMASGQIEINGELVDLNSISSPELGALIDSLSQGEREDLFTSITQADLGTLLEKLPFNTLNQTIINLDDSTINQIAGTLSQGTFNDIAISLTDETFGSIFTSLNNVNLSSLLNNASNGPLSLALGGLQNDPLNYIFTRINGGLANELIGNLDIGAINNIFGNMSGNFVNMVIGNLGLTSLNTVFSNISLSVLNEILPSLSSNIVSGILPNLGLDSLTQLFGGANSSILNEALNGVSSGIINQAIEQLPTDLVEEIADVVPNVDDALQDSIPDPLDPIDGGGGGFGGLYVPVVEQGGQLMNLTRSIDTTEKEIKDLSVQICTHLKAIRRIQTKFETKLVEDADVSRIKATEIEKYRQALFDAIKNGGARLDEDGNEVKDAPLFIANNKLYIENAGQEGAKIAIDKIAQNNNSNNLAIFEGLQAENSFGRSGPNINDIHNVFGTGDQPETILGVKGGSFDNIPILSTLLRPMRNAFAWLTGNKAWAAPDPPIIENIDSDQFWASFLNIVASNPGIAYLRAQGDIEQSKNREILAARDEALQAQGFKPVRTCVSKTSDGKNCEAWAIIQPGIIVKEAGTAGLNSRLTQYENADSIGEISQGNEPDVGEFLTMTPSTSGGGGVGPGMVEPISIPQRANDELRSDPNINSLPDNPDDDPDNPDDDQDEPCQQENWLISFLIDLLNRVFTNSDIVSSNDLSLLNYGLLTLADNCQGTMPFVFFGHKDRGDGNHSLYWFSPNATTPNGCKTKNDWVSDSEIIKPNGANLNIPWGNLSIIISEDTTTETTYELECINEQGATTQTVTI